MVVTEAINTIKSLKQYYNDENEDSYVGFDNEDNEALDMASRALEVVQGMEEVFLQVLPELDMREATEEERSSLNHYIDSISKSTGVKFDFNSIKTELKPCEDCVSREALINELKLGYFNKDLQEGKNDPCVIDAMIDWAIRTVKRQPSFTPKTSCKSCREQVLKHLEKEDWADTVNCVMNMPFMKAESGVEE